MKYIEVKYQLEKIKEIAENIKIGRSLLGEPVYSYHIGSYEGKQILLTGGIHAREYISSLFLIEELKYMIKEEIVGGIYFIPLLNPDGVRLVMDGVKFIQDEKLQRFLIDINGGKLFNLWKANANGVDLNVNFDAKWGGGVSNIQKLARENFIGYYPNSEIENLNIINYLKKIKIDTHIAFHSKGEVIYYGFKKSDETLRQERELVKIVSSKNGYMPIVSSNSTGGLSDYIAQEYDIPSFTIELGADYLSHPISEIFLETIFSKNKEVPKAILNYLNYGK